MAHSDILDSACYTTPRKSYKNRLRAVILALVSIAISSLVGLTLAENLVGLIRPHELIFPADTVVLYETGEFSFTVKINSMGFRDREVTPKAAGKRRVVVIGDSFVYGWGVQIEQSWPKRLEAEL